MFLRNHDELTLEMVTDEERDYMYRVYATDRQARINLGIRRRLAPLLGNNRRKIELMNGLLFSLGGTPVIYYGDEIGMGDNVYLGDRNGVRTPMQWSPDRNAGFSKANPQSLYLPVIIDPEYHFETVNVEAQQGNPHSMLWWIRRLIALRQRHAAFGRGTLEFLHPENPKVLVFVREYESERILVVANLSRFVQCVELDLSKYRGARPIEMFGQTPFPAIGDLPYFLTLGPHSFYWFEIGQTPHLLGPSGGAIGDVSLRVTESISDVTTGSGRRELEKALPAILSGRRWFGGKSQRIESVSIVDVVPMPARHDGLGAQILIVQIVYRDAESDLYQMPIALLEGEEAARFEQEKPGAVLARVLRRGGEWIGIVCDAAHSPGFATTLLETMTGQRRMRGERSQVRCRSTRRLRQREPSDDLVPSVLGAEQSNTSIIFGEQFIMKLFRRLGVPGGGGGANPDVEVGQFLTERASFPNTPPTLGSIEYVSGREELRTLAALQLYVPNEGDAWRLTLDMLSSYFERVLTEEPESPVLVGTFLPFKITDAPPTAGDAIGPYLQSAEQLGTRTAELHLALASDSEDPAFAPEEFTAHNVRSFYQSMRNLTRSAMRAIRRQIDVIPEDVLPQARQLLESEQALISRVASLLDGGLGGLRIRTHGDFHLGQVLYTGRDFYIIDFEGEPARPLSERRMKRSPLRDVAGMLRSFDYAAWTALEEHQRRWGGASDAERDRLNAWADFWRRSVTAVYLRSYVDTAQARPILPASSAQCERMIEAFLIEKAVYELEYELNNRPNWVRVPLQGLSTLLAREDTT